MKDILESIGFTVSEAKVYLALLDLGSTTSGPLIKKASIPQGKVYVILDKLISKGIVTYTVKSNIKHFQAKNPDSLLDWFEKKEIELGNKKKELLKVLPSLKAKFESAKYEKQVEIYEGFKALKTLYDGILKEAKELLIIGSTRDIPKELEIYLMHWHQQRIEKKIKIKFIYSNERRKYAKNREQMPFTKVKYLELPLSPSWTTICNDMVITVTMIDIKNISCFVIQDKNVAKAQKIYFDVLWTRSVDM